MKKISILIGFLIVSLVSFGHQLTYTPSSKFSINSSSFIGADQPDSSRMMRYYHNAYAIYHIHEKISLIGGFDIGFQQQSKHSSAYNVWYTPIVMLRHKIKDNQSFTIRAEYYQDPNQVIIATNTLYGIRTSSFSLNYFITNRL